MRNIVGVLLLGVCLIGPAGGSAAFAEDEQTPAELSGRIEKGYVKTAIGQVHYRIISPAQPSGHSPIALFNPNPYSGLYYVHFMDVMGTDRTVLAFDTPGYGGSDRPSAPLSMQEIGDVMAEALIALGYGPNEDGPVVVSGYHTGAYIAGELAANYPDLVEKAVLVGVPFWQDEELEKHRRELLLYNPIPVDGPHLERKWEFSVQDRNPLIKVSRAQNLFAESLRAGRETWWAYSAVVGWPAAEKFAQIEQPVLLLNNHGGLKENTRAVLPLLQDGELVELPGLTNGIWDVGADRLAQEFRTFLDSNP